MTTLNELLRNELQWRNQLLNLILELLVPIIKSQANNRFHIQMTGFHTFLQDKILKTTSKKELLIKLQLEYEEFHSLEPLTLDRWIKGRTVPSLYKQLLIVKLYQCFPAYLESFQEAKISTSDRRIFNQFLARLDSPYHRILSSQENEYLFHRQGKYSDLYLHVESYVGKIGMLESISDQFHYANLYTDLLSISSKDSKNLESFLLMQHGFNIHSSCANFAGDKLEYSAQNCITVTLTYFRSSEHFFLLCGLFANLVLEHHPKKKRVIILSRGIEGLMLSEALGGNLIRSIPDEMYGNLYITEFDFIRLFSNPLIINTAKRYARVYQVHFDHLLTTPLKLSSLPNDGDDSKEESCYG
ncbi:hypothetical protein [Vibrio parahaemolyticus]|uniref:hypothetical protein n=1 Tax=Vibrio parahaemolyticus TaxID=670 RepID=UPI00236133BF|nr:hypothetical protein [Vibrio parahaemolyticus]